MVESILHLLRCPLTRKAFELQVVDRKFHPVYQQHIVHTGILKAPGGGWYPVIDGIARLLPESMEEHHALLSSWDKSFPTAVIPVLEQYRSVIDASAKRNRKIRETFSFEWDIIRRYPQTFIWERDEQSFAEQTIRELGLPLHFRPAAVLDAGCGHGRSTQALAKVGGIVIGAEISDAVVVAFSQNKQPNCFYVQADVHQLPFADAVYDLIYCSGVLHHNPDTKAAFLQLTALLKPVSVLVVWLYHPFHNPGHTAMRALRGITSKMPVRWVNFLNSISLTPMAWLYSKIRGKGKSWHALQIELLDMLTPAYRHEHRQDEVRQWYAEAGFAQVDTTDNDNYGFALSGKKGL